MRLATTLGIFRRFFAITFLAGRLVPLRRGRVGGSRRRLVPGRTGGRARLRGEQRLVGSSVLAGRRAKRGRSVPDALRHTHQRGLRHRWTHAQQGGIPVGLRQGEFCVAGAPQPFQTRLRRQQRRSRHPTPTTSLHPSLSTRSAARRPPRRARLCARRARRSRRPPASARRLWHARQRAQRIQKGHWPALRTPHALLCTRAPLCGWLSSRPLPRAPRSPPPATLHSPPPTRPARQRGWDGDARGGGGGEGIACEPGRRTYQGPSGDRRPSRSPTQSPTRPRASSHPAHRSRTESTHLSRRAESCIRPTGSRMTTSPSPHPPAAPRHRHALHHHWPSLKVNVCKFNHTQ
jgi:hypothetical protein